ncbi:hypothetical protein [Lentzea sp. NPDC051838]|uniref:hypothetical protein n=1 Tax=Lentzea sp. NPDC051838 TaxID=3154849 RepID=UPI003449A1E9
MGLDAFVRCRCWQDGVVTPPAALAGLIVLEDEYLGLSVPWEGHESLHNALDKWVSSACSHEDMDLVCEHVGNWASYRGLQRALGTMGWEHFPVLQGTLPNGNGGCTPASSAASALEELQFYTSHAVMGLQAVLCDADTGEVLLEQIHAFGGLNVFADGVAYGVDLDGFFVQKEGLELFRSMAFNAAGVPGTPFGARNLEVRSRLEDADVYSYTVNALVRLFEASVASGNPVVWC